LISSCSSARRSREVEVRRRQGERTEVLKTDLKAGTLLAQSVALGLLQRVTPRPERLDNAALEALALLASLSQLPTDDAVLGPEPADAALVWDDAVLEQVAQEGHLVS
jgi:hypothetical protein